MTYEQAKKLEEKHRAQGRRNMVTAYVFLLLSAIVFGIFYLKVHELTLAGCGFLCDAAALLYLLVRPGYKPEETARTLTSVEAAAE